MKPKGLNWVGVLCMLHACVVSAAEQKPNLLWITSEDMSAKWLGCHGNKQIKTPNFDKLAQEGFLYTHCFAHAPVCAPACASAAATIPRAWWGDSDCMVQTFKFEAPTAREVVLIGVMVSQEDSTMFKAGTLKLKN